MYPFLQWKRNKYYIFWVWVCSLRYSVWNAHILYRHLWSCPLYRIFQLYFTNCTILEEKNTLLNIKCVIWCCLQFSSTTCPVLRTTERDIIKNVYWSSSKVKLFLSDFNETWIFSTDFRKILKYWLRWKIRPEKAEFFFSCGQKNGQTDRQDKTKLRVTFRNFVNTPKKFYKFRLTKFIIRCPFIKVLRENVCLQH
jgi:hypothetical protein